MTTLGHAEQDAVTTMVSLHPALPGVLGTNDDLELEVTCPYYFETTKDQCQDLSWPRALCHSIRHLCYKANVTHKTITKRHHEGTDLKDDS